MAHLPPSTCPQLGKTPESWRCMGCQKPLILNIIQLPIPALERFMTLTTLQGLRNRCFQLLLELRRK